MFHCTLAETQSHSCILNVSLHTWMYYCGFVVHVLFISKCSNHVRSIKVTKITLVGSWLRIDVDRGLMLCTLFCSKKHLNQHTREYNKWWVFRPILFPYFKNKPSFPVTKIFLGHLKQRSIDSSMVCTAISSLDACPLIPHTNSSFSGGLSSSRHR